MNQSLLQFMDECPPALVRVMSVTCGKGRAPKLKSLRLISKDSGLPFRTVQRLATRPTWSGVKVGVASRFIDKGCNVDVLNKQPKPGSKKMTRYYFLRHYIEKGMPHLKPSHRDRLFAILGWA